MSDFLLCFLVGFTLVGMLPAHPASDPDSRDLTPNDRLARIANLLLRAACRASSQPVRQNAAPVASASETRQQILQLLDDLGTATPRQLLALLDVSRATLARELQGLHEQGLIMRTGRTRRTQYTLPDHSRTIRISNT